MPPAGGVAAEPATTVVAAPSPAAAPGVAVPVVGAAPGVAVPVVGAAPGVAVPVVGAAPGVVVPVVGAAPGVVVPVVGAAPGVAAPALEAAAGVAAPSPGDTAPALEAAPDAGPTEAGAGSEADGAAPAAPAALPGLAVLGERLPVTLADGRTVDYANLDYAATAPCLSAVADAVNELLPWHASVHRGAGAASRRCTLAYERARQSVADFLDARPDDHVIFTRNTTDALNLLARALPEQTTVVGWAGEHHANLLPWPRFVRLPVPESPDAALRSLAAALAVLRAPAGLDASGSAPRPGPAAQPVPPGAAPQPGQVARPVGLGAAPRPGQVARPVGLGASGSAPRPGAGGDPVLVAVTGASNVTGEVWPIERLAAVAHRYGARIVVDAAQLAVHRPVSLRESGVDYVALSGHKLYAPFGAGVLAGRADWLDAAPPYLAGGGATEHVGDATHDVRWHAGPARHEAGTPNLLGAVALATACERIAAADRRAIDEREQVLLRRLRDGLARLPRVAELRAFAPDHDRVGIVSFAVADVPASAVSEHLANRYGIGVRDGLFCAHPLGRRLLGEASARLGRPLGGSAVRASIGLGTTREHVDRLLAGLRDLVDGD